MKPKTKRMSKAQMDQIIEEEVKQFDDKYWQKMAEDFMKENGLDEREMMYEGRKQMLNEYYVAPLIAAVLPHVARFVLSKVAPQLLKKLLPNLFKQLMPNLFKQLLPNLGKQLLPQITQAVMGSLTGQGGGNMNFGGNMGGMNMGGMNFGGGMDMGGMNMGGMGGNQDFGKTLAQGLMGGLMKGMNGGKGK